MGSIVGLAGWGRTRPAAGSGDDDETVRAVFIAARHADGDAVRARLLLGLRRELVRQKTRVSALQGALPAAGARQAGKSNHVNRPDPR